MSDTDKHKQEEGAKAAANIVRGASAGGIHGAALAAAGSTARRWVIPLTAVILIPVVLLTMLPSIIFGPFLGDGTDTPSGLVDDQTLSRNLTDLNAAISSVLSEGLGDVLNRIEQNFSASGCDEKEINNPYGTDAVFNANAIVSQYCAYKDQEAESISREDLVNILLRNKSHLYSFTFSDDVRTIEAEPDPGDKSAEPEIKTVTVRIYTISYNGEKYLADKVFKLDGDQKERADQYAQNLTVLLGDGVYQGITDHETEGPGVSYEDVIFTDGETRIKYYNQMDRRWKDRPYGTDNVGGYGCGPTSMAIVVSSLTSDTVDPAQMAKWAYENGHWCSGNGSYHSLIPNAAKHWGLHVEGCTAAEPQRIIDALENGNLVVAIMGKGHFTKSGHFIVLRGVKTDGTVMVADPASYSRSQIDWNLSLVLKEASKRASAGGPFWIIGN